MQALADPPIQRRRSHHPVSEAAVARGSDEVRQAYALLHHNSHFRSGSHGITIHHVDQKLELHGSVTSFYLKQVLQETLRPLGVQIVNRVVVA